MTPEQFQSSLRTRTPEPVYLFLGPESYTRDQCRKALLGRVLPPEQREDGFTRYSLDQASLVEVLDDARAMSLFAAERVIWAGAAEAAVPREAAAAKEGSPELQEYLANPTPGVVLVFDCSRYQFDGEDKAKVDRVRKFFAGVNAQVDFPHLEVGAARRLAGVLAKEAGLKAGDAELDLLVEVLDADATRIATEIEKLSVYAGPAGKITEAEIWALVPNARATTIFALVAALGRRDRTGSLDALDLLVKEGEYLPLALSFLSTQFRMALAAKEAGLSTPSQVQAHFAKLGVAMWPSRAQQVCQTVAAFPAERLRAGIEKIYETDKALRDTRPDDRTVMERFVLSVT